MNLLQRGQAMLNRVLGDPDHGAGVAVTYARPSAGWAVPVTAWPGDESATAGTVGATLAPRREDAERDYLIPVAALVTAAGDPFLPRRGDRLTEAINGAACVFEVTARDGEPPWRFSDLARTRVRVHTKRVQ